MSTEIYCDLLMKELKFLQNQSMPKFPSIVRWIRKHAPNCNKNSDIEYFCYHLRNIFMSYCKYFFNSSSDALDSISSELVKVIESTFKSLFSKSEVLDLNHFICFEFSLILSSKFLRIIRQLENTTQCEADNFLLVRTLNGELNFVNVFYGLVIFTIPTANPFSYSNLSPFQVIHNNTSINLVPSLNGFLYKLKNNLVVPLNLNVEELLSSDVYTSDVLFTGSKKTDVKQWNRYTHDSFDGFNIFPETKKMLTKMKLLIKNTQHTLVARDRSKIEKKWSFSVNHIDLISDSFSNDINIDERSSTLHYFKINAEKGEIYRLMDHKQSYNNFVWKLKLKSSILNAWIYENNILKKIDLFSTPHIDIIENNCPKYFVGYNKRQKKHNSKYKSMYIRESQDFLNESNSKKSDWLDLLFKEQPSDYTFEMVKKGNSFYVYKLNKAENIIEDYNAHSTVIAKKESLFENNFNIVKKLGEGAFGIVVEASHKHDKRSYAIKRIKFRNINLKNKIQWEVEVQAKLKHDNVVNYHSSWLEEPSIDWEDPFESILDYEEEYSNTISSDYSTSYGNNFNAFFYIQMELCKGGNLHEWLLKNNSGEIRSKEYQNIFEQIVKGVEYIHTQGLIHRDLKPQNIFFFSETNIKIGDFGLVTNIFEEPVETPIKQRYPLFKNIKHTPNVGTSLYMAPEQKDCMIYDYKVDIWSLAIIRVELLIVFKTGTERCKVLEKLHRKEFPQLLIDEFPEECQVLRLMLKDNPKERLCTYGVRAHPPINHDVDKIYYFNLPT